MHRGSDSTTRFRRLVRSRARREERAMVIVWFALTLTLMLGFAGFGADLSNWWLQSERLQRAADAGAHAGVVFLPGDLTTATNTARSTVASNGFPIGAGTTVAVQQEPNPNQLRVNVSTEVRTFFTHLVGVDSIRLERSAVAEYVQALPMGSPQNKLGNDPDGDDPGSQLWVALAGPTTAKHNGDQYGARRCELGEFHCTGTTNNEYSEEGYAFTVNVKQVPGNGEPLMIQAFDPAFVAVNPTCNRNVFPSVAQRTTLSATFPDAMTRFAPGPGPYCTGDSFLTNTQANQHVQTTFIVRRPDDTPWSFTDNPLETSCDPVTARSWVPNNANFIFNLLTDPVEGSLDPADPHPSFAKTWRRWYTVCSIPNHLVQTGEYIVQVRTNATPLAPLQYNAGITGDGANFFSLRAGFGETGLDAVDGGDVTLAARGRLPIFANASGADTRFHLARVLPFDAGRTLRVTLFDVGDAQAAGSFRVIPPEEFGSNFSGCAFRLDNGAAMNTTPSMCRINNMTRTVYNGRLIEIDVPIPQDYTCDAASPTGCWVKVQAAYPPGTGVTDFTTWTAAILGNPVRLVE